MSRLLQEQSLALLGTGAFVATVISVQDPNNLNRVQVRVFDVDGIADQDGAVWARVAVPFAG
ncbi:MAG: phage baseplate assembly protein V, partial [Terracidiphilus sp.]